MKKTAAVFAAILVLAGAVAVSAGGVSPIVVAAGRVRFAQGAGLTLAFEGRRVRPDIDVVVPVGARIETGEGRLEVQTVDGNLYWFGPATVFDFESSDPTGERSSLFLGRGSLVVATRRPVTVITASGSVFCPGGGTYSIVKPELGPTAVRVSTVSGRAARVLRQATFLSRFKIGVAPDEELLAWTRERQKLWKMTLARANLYSRVDVLPPMVATRGSDGKVHWHRVKAAGPLGWLQGQVVDNTYLAFSPRMMRAQNVLPAIMSTSWTDYEIWLWYTVERYNAIRWAWDVVSGWHAEWYYDPLAGFSAQFNALEPFFSAFIWPPNIRAVWPDYPWMGVGGPGFPFWYGFGGPFSFIPPDPLPVLVNRGGGLVRPTRDLRERHFLGRIPVREHRPAFVALRRPARIRLRLETDPGLRSPRMAARLDPRQRDFERLRRGPSAVFRGGSLVNGGAFRGGTVWGRASVARSTSSAPRSVSMVSRSAPSGGGARVSAGGKGH